jgi:glycosyltransferase involved in cell wall biosynthesis
MPPGNTPRDDLDVAVAHWHVEAWGGAEYLVTKLAAAVDADRVYTLGEPSPADPNPYGDVTFVDVVPDLRPRLLRRLQQRAGRAFEYALWEDVDWRKYGDPDVLVTSGATSRAVITPETTLHVNYCHSPPRWFYDLYHDRKGSLTGTLLRPLLRHLRTRDAAIDPRVDRYLANSPVIGRRIRKYYNRESTVLYPPVDLDSFHDDGDGGFYLHLGRLDRQKGVEAVVEAFEELDHRLVFAGGEGDAGDAVLGRIRRADNMEYRGFVPEATKRDLLSRCRALVFNGLQEDFGIVLVEANASGKPVLARNEGFPAVYVTDGDNGFRHDGSPDGIRATVRRMESTGVSGDVRAGLERFTEDVFRTTLTETLAEWYDDLLEL